MAFINLDEAHPKQGGLYKVVVDTADSSSYETEAEWVMGEGFVPTDGTLRDDSRIVSWWSKDNVR